MPNQIIALLPLLFMLAAAKGLVNAVGIDSVTGDRLGAADPRDESAAVGY